VTEYETGMKPVWT